MSKKHHKTSGQVSVSLSPDEDSVIQHLLDDLSGISLTALPNLLQNVRLALVFLDRVPPGHPRALELVLATQSAFPEKEVKKSARKALFRLKQRGVQMPEKQREDSNPITETRLDQAPEPSAYLCPPDGMGNRAVFLTIPRLPAGVDLGMGVVSDEKGVLEFVSGRYSKKKAREVREFFFQSVAHLFETSLAHAATVLEGAYQKGKSGAGDQSGDYLKIRPWLLENVSLINTAPVYELIPSGEVPKEITPSQVDRLLAHHWMKSWIIDPEMIKPLIEEIANVQQSPILVSEEQRSGRIQDLKEDFISRVYSEERRSLIKHRLEETAYLLQKAGEDEYARFAVSAALSLEEKDSKFSANLFLRHMVERSLGLYMDTTEGARKESPKDSQEQPSSRLILPR